MHGTSQTGTSSSGWRQWLLLWRILGTTRANKSNYSDFLVFRYEAKSTVPHHGGVKVTYKDRLSTKGIANEAEWLPISTIDKNGIMANVTTDELMGWFSFLTPQTCARGRAEKSGS